MPADPIVPTSPVGPADQPTVPVNASVLPQPRAPAPASAQVVPQPLAVPAQPVPAPAPQPPPQRPATWAARAAVPGAAPPGARKNVGVTQTIVRYIGVGPAPGRSEARRFFAALLSVLLILAVPLVSAYVSYKLASGENPFEWPPTVDLSHVF
jgi:hypothetical protein